MTVICGECDGRGWQTSGDKQFDCDLCDGHGTISDIPDLPEPAAETHGGVVPPSVLRIPVLTLWAALEEQAA